VTIADLYETDGSVIGPRVAERLEVPLLDLVIPEEPTRRAGVSEDAVADGYEEPRGVDRLFSVAACATTVTRSQTSTPGALDHKERRLRGAIEEALAETTRSDGLAIALRAYDVQGLDPGLYHLKRDSTAVPLDTCVELLVVTARARPGQPRKTAPT
jgi:hypothetical protein